MNPTDEDLLEFTNTKELEYHDKLNRGSGGDATDLLAKHGGVFRQHLIVAKLLEYQADHLEHSSADKAYGKIELRGYKVALRHTIDDLRDGSFLPGGHRFEENFGEP